MMMSSNRKAAKPMELYLADNLRYLRAKRGGSLEALAETVGVSRQAAAKWESGETFPDLPNCVKLAGLFQVTLDELVLEPLRTRRAQAGGPKDQTMGLVTVSDVGQVRIPAEVLDMFGIRAGENVLLLADRARGIALMKCRQMDGPEQTGP